VTSPDGTTRIGELAIGPGPAFMAGPPFREPLAPERVEEPGQRFSGHWRRCDRPRTKADLAGR
jgi:hypothetical protein